MSDKNRETDPSSFGRIFSAVWKEQRAKGAFFIKGSLRQQREMAAPPRGVSEMIGGLWRSAPRLPPPAPIPSFEEVSRRSGLTEVQISAQMRFHLRLHWLYYSLGLCALLYTWWFLLNYSFLRAIPCAVVSLGLVVNGYLQGVRAWQILNRRTVSLAYALRDASTYLVF